MSKHSILKDSLVDVNSVLDKPKETAIGDYYVYFVALLATAIVLVLAVLKIIWGSRFGKKSDELKTALSAAYQLQENPEKASKVDMDLEMMLD